MTDKPNDPYQEKLDKLKALKNTLGSLDLGELQSYPHLIEMLKIRDPMERLKYLNEHKGELERDKEFLTGLINQAGLNTEDLQNMQPPPLNEEEAKGEASGA